MNRGLPPPRLPYLPNSFLMSVQQRLHEYSRLQTRGDWRAADRSSQPSPGSPPSPPPPRTPPPPPPRDEPRLVRRVDYSTRRHELMRANKPYYVYRPTMPLSWTQEDFVRHNQMRDAVDPWETVRVPTEEDENQVSSTQMVGLQTCALKRFIGPQQRTDLWWLVVDTRVLLDDLKFVDKLLKSDSECRLRIPYEVLHDLSAMNRRHNHSWARIPARRVSRYILRETGRDKPAIGQSAMDAEDLLDTPVATDSVVNCCLQQMRKYYYVVLISDDAERRARAHSVYISAYSLQEVKQLVMVAIGEDKRGYHLALTRNYDEDAAA